MSLQSCPTQCDLIHVCNVVITVFNYFKIIMNGYTPFIIIVKYLLYSACYSAYPLSLFIPGCTSLSSTPMPTFPLPTGNHYFASYVCNSALFCYIQECVSFFTFHL